MSEPMVVNVDEAEEIVHSADQYWGQSYRVLTPEMAKLSGVRLGVNVTRVKKGFTACPFHGHQREDEAFYVLSGRGVLRYGEHLRDIRPGDCISCPAGTGVAHQIANPYDEDLVYLAMGVNDSHEVAFYPDNGKVLIRSLGKIGFLESADYMAGEPERPRIFDLIDARKG